MFTRKFEPLRRERSLLAGDCTIRSALEVNVYLYEAPLRVKDVTFLTDGGLR